MDNSIQFVSIIIPVYNSALFLGETLESVVNQSYTNWECIIVDDHSVDESVDIINQYLGRYSHKIKFFSNSGKGACDARNMGMENALGHYIKFLDSDDVLFDNKVLEQQINFLETTQFSIVYGQEYYYQDVFTNDKLLKKRGKEIKSPNDFFDNFPITSNFFTTKATLNLLRWNSELRSGQEFYLLFQCLIRGLTFGYQPIPITKIRVHNSIHRISVKSKEQQSAQSLNLIEHMSSEIKAVEVIDPKLLMKIKNQFLLSSYQALRLKELNAAKKIQEYFISIDSKGLETNAIRALYFVNSVSLHLGYWLYKACTRLGYGVLDVK